MTGYAQTAGGVTTRHALDGQSAVREEITKPGSTTETETYLTGPRGPEYRRSSGGTLRWYVYDGLGSVVGEVDASGTLASSTLYDVYGMPREGLGTPSSSHQFVGGLGHASEGETGLVYMRARYMDPAYSEVYWFVYANSNPVNHIDQNGRIPVTITGAGALLAGAMAILGYDFVEYSPALERTLHMLDVALGMAGVQAHFKKVAEAEWSSAVSDAA